MNLSDMSGFALGVLGFFGSLLCTWYFQWSLTKGLVLTVVITVLMAYVGLFLGSLVSRFHVELTIEDRFEEEKL